MEWVLHLLLFLKGFVAGAVYNFVSLTSNLFIADLTLKKDKRAGILCGFGLSCSHILWSTLAAFALSITFINIHENQYIYTLIGSIILFYFAYRIYRKKKKKLSLKKPPSKALYLYSEGMLLGFSSPSKILGYAIIFSALGVSETDPKLIHKIPLIFGVFIGSFSWWLIYPRLIAKKVHHFSPKKIRLYQKISAFVLALVGILGLIESLKGLR